MTVSLSAQLTQSLKAEAARLGFAISGVCPAVTPAGFHQFTQWLDAGYAGEMNYLHERRAAYQHPSGVLPETKSLLMLGMNYQTQVPAFSSSGTGRIARYAWGETDYHDLIHTRLRVLKEFALELFANEKIKDALVRGVVDTAPLLEREFAQLAGIGWSAKNTMLISREHGSWFFIAALLTNVQLEYDTPFVADHCGTCTACLDACPTNAFPEPGVLDATKCISYLTIEQRGPIAMELRPQIGDWILGCDICQEVCPWNRKAPLATEPEFAPLPENNPLKLADLFSLTDEEFRVRFRKTPLWRPKRRGILRNAAIALGNRPDLANLVPLALGLNDVEPLVRGASAWALGRHGAPGVELLKIRQAIESDAEVIQEIEMALNSPPLNEN